jgi:hypothetical protein
LQGIHYTLPVLFDYFHLSAVSVTVHAALISIHQPYLPSPRSASGQTSFLCLWSWLPTPERTSRLLYFLCTGFVSYALYTVAVDFLIVPYKSLYGWIRQADLSAFFYLKKLVFTSLGRLLREKMLQLIYEYNCLLHPLYECRVFMLILWRTTI